MGQGRVACGGLQVRKRGNRHQFYCIDAKIAQCAQAADDPRVGIAYTQVGAGMPRARAGMNRKVTHMNLFDDGMRDIRARSHIPLPIKRRLLGDGPGRMTDDELPRHRSGARVRDVGTLPGLMHAKAVIS